MFSRARIHGTFSRVDCDVRPQIKSQKIFKDKYHTKYHLQLEDEVRNQWQKESWKIHKIVGIKQHTFKQQIKEEITKAKGIRKYLEAKDEKTTSQHLTGHNGSSAKGDLGSYKCLC